MVALDEHFHHKGTKAPRRCHCGSEAAHSEKSPARRITDVASPRRRRASFISAPNSCVKFNNQQSVPNSFVSLSLGGETRQRRGTSISPGFQNRPLLIAHCSLIFERSADAYGNTLIFSAPDSTGNWWGDAAVQSNYGANEIVFCGYRFDPETQLYYVRNRTYNPVLGRWIQRDPIGYSGGINLYGYCGGAVPGIRLCEEYLPNSLPYRLHFAHAWLSIGKSGWGFHPGRPAAGNLGVLFPSPGLIINDINCNNLPEKGGRGWQNGYKVCYFLYVNSCLCALNKSAAGVKAALAAARKGPLPDHKC